MSTVQRNGTQPSMQGPAEYFTGNVRVDPLFKSPGPAPVSGSYVTFEPGARSAWHTHPCGQTLIVTAGLGWTQCEGEPKQESPRRRRHLSARQEALARRDRQDRGDAHCDPGIQGRQGGRVAGEGQR